MADEYPQVFPSLSEDGWIDDDRHISNKIFAQFLVADKHQSETTRGIVESMPAIIQENVGNITEVCNQTRLALESLYGRYFSGVVVLIEERVNPENESKVALSIYVGYTDRNGVRQTLGRDMNITGSSIEKVTAINNA